MLVRVYRCIKLGCKAYIIMFLFFRLSSMIYIYYNSVYFGRAGSPRAFRLALVIILIKTSTVPMLVEDVAGVRPGIAHALISAANDPGE